MPSRSTKTRIIGIGNPLMGDDGVGIAAVECLRAMALPEGVEAVDGGTCGLTLLDLMEGAGTVILVDAVETGKPPGTVVRFTPEEVVLPEGEAAPSLHEAGLAQVLTLGREMDLLPSEIVIYGVQPASVECRLGLSPSVAHALGHLLERILAELEEPVACQE